MSSRITITGTEPVSVEEIKLYAKIETGAEDAFLEALITACREEVEAMLGVALIDQEREVSLDAMLGVVWAPLIPVSSAAVEIDGAAWTDFSLRTDVGRLKPLAFAPRPAALADGVVVTWTYASVAPRAAIVNALKDLVAYRFDHRADGEARGIPDAVRLALAPFKVHRV